MILPLPKKLQFQKLLFISRLAVLTLMALACSSIARAQNSAPMLINPQLSLSDALRLASQNSVTLKQVRADADASSAAAFGALAQTRLGLSATTYATVGDSSNILTTSPGVSPQNVFLVAPHPFADQNLMLMVPLFSGGRLQNALTSARRQSEASLLSVQASRLSVTVAVIEDYTGAALGQSLVSVAQARMARETEQVRVVQEKVSAGRSAPVELLREQAEFAEAAQALLAAQNSAALALVSLKTVLGVSQESQIVLADTLDTLAGKAAALEASAAPLTLREALRRADSNRPEPAAAQQRVEAAQSAARAVRGEYAPQVYGVAMADAASGQGVGRTGYTVGLTASLPLFDGGQRHADLDGAKARLARALADAEQVCQQVDQETAAAWLNAQTATAQVAAARAGVDAAQKDYDLAVLRYNAGKSIAVERLDALAALTRAQGALASAQAGAVTTQARLQAALGAP